MTKFVFVTGGVVSSLGKGIAASSIGSLLKSRGLEVTIQKFDPYLNVDPGTMSPYQHGEVFVTDDGAETDLDVGHYERFLGVSMHRENNVTAGQVYDSIIQKERRGDYLGRTVQVIPHVTDEIKARMLGITKSQNQNVDVAIVEIGGTVGDIESLPFLEAIRQLRLELRRDNTLFVHVTLVPHLGAAREMKTKPTQHSVRELRAIGIQPDILLCRTEIPLPTDVKEKIALFCNVPKEAVIEAIDVASIYEIPLMFHRGGLDDLIIEYLRLTAGAPGHKARTPRAAPRGRGKGEGPIAVGREKPTPPNSAPTRRTRSSTSWNPSRASPGRAGRCGSAPTSARSLRAATRRRRTRKGASTSATAIATSSTIATAKTWSSTGSRSRACTRT